MSNLGRILILLPLVVLWAGCGPGDEAVGVDDGSASIEPIPEGPLPRQVIPEACSLRMTILPDTPTFSGETEIAVSVKEPVRRVWIHGKDLDVSGVEFIVADGRRLSGRYRQVHQDGIALLEFTENIPAGPARLRMKFSGRFADDVSGVFRVSAEGNWYGFSDFQPIQARRAFPGFDEPAFKIPYDIEIVTRESYVALSNAGEDETEVLAGGMKRVSFHRTPPLPSYLVAFAVGPLDVVEGPPLPAGPRRDRAVKIRGIAAKGRGSDLQYALDQTPKMVEILEDYFQLNYPYQKLDLVAVPGYPYAMENPGLIFYSEYLLLLDENPSLRQLQSFGATHAHELAHQWFGNLVTMAWWDDLWLNEAFANWMAGKVMIAWRPELRYQRQALADVFRTMDSDSLPAARSVRATVNDAARMFAAFDDLTYVKGAAILAMLENYLGEEAFRQGLQRYLDRFAHGNADVFDLVESLQEDTREDLDIAGILRSFLFRPGVPLLSATVGCTGDRAVVRLRQQRYFPLGVTAQPSGPWSIPVCMSWGQSSNSAAASRCFVMREPVADVPLDGDCPDWLMPNRAAAGYYRWEIEPADFLPLARSRAGLSGLERMAVADSLAAAVRSGRLGVGDYLARLPDLAASLERSAAMAPVPEMRRIMSYLLDTDQRLIARAYFAAVYGRRLKFLERPGGAEDSPEKERFRFELMRFLAEDVRDEEVRSGFRELARARLTSENSGVSDAATLSPDLVSTIYTVGVQDLGTPFFDQLADDLETETSAARRRHILTAIGAAEDPLLLARARNLLLDEVVSPGEMPVLLGRLSEPERIAGTRDWFRGNRAALFERYPAVSRSYLPLYFSSFCDQRDFGEMERLFEGYQVAIPGIMESVRQAREKVAVCEAYRKKNAAPARDFFENLGSEAGF